MTQTLKTSERLGVVDALRGFALLAIVLLHNLEHYNLFLVPENVPAWLQTIDKYAWDILFFLFAGKAYATFSLLFGFSFYIQFHNAEKRGIDFRGRFAWRMCLLFLFAQLHALFYNGDILLLYAVVGFALIPVCKLKDKTVFWIALILLLQPYEWGRAIYAMINPDYVVATGHYMPYAIRAQEVTANGNFFEVLCSNISDGIIQQYLASRKWSFVSDGCPVHVRNVTGAPEIFNKERRIRTLLEEDVERCCPCIHSSLLP